MYYTLLLINLFILFIYLLIHKVYKYHIFGKRLYNENSNRHSEKTRGEG